MTAHHPLVLASASPRRLDLLKQISITPRAVHPANIDESVQKNERPQDHALRLAIEKADAIRSDHDQDYILAADTVVACGQRILPKAENEEQAKECLRQLSGRRHHVYGGICLIAPDGTKKTRLCDTTVKFKRLSDQEITRYLHSMEWKGKAGGYAIQGLAATYINFIQGSYSNVVGLSLYDTMQLLSGNGFFHDRA